LADPPAFGGEDTSFEFVRGILFFGYGTTSF
jgi:hypothetical protein